MHIWQQVIVDINFIYLAVLTTQLGCNSTKSTRKLVYQATKLEQTDMPLFFCDEIGDVICVKHASNITDQGQNAS